MQLLKMSATFMSIWLVSSVAFSNGSVAPELPILAGVKNSPEYPVLRRIQDLTLELQLLEITVKNRRDAQIEEKISGAIKAIENQGTQIGDKFKAIRKEQLEGIFSLFTLARTYGNMMGVAAIEWDELLGAIRDGQITAGMLTIHGRSGTLNILSLTPLYIGRQLVWSASLPTFDRKSFWVQARARARYLGYRGVGPISNAALVARTERLNASYGDAEKLTKEFFTTGYSKLYLAFETQRYAILQRVQLARRALVELEKNNTAMGTPEEFSTLYNQVLENLFSYGVDISVSGASQRDFAVKGFLFAESPERSQELLKKLKYSPSSTSYNSPSS
ncbi:MAG: hypothetical protein HY074_19185 [Deltaproteobacteria bacterium]|nr:hypothetical protein [Deltaproteobacteria bacterium]